MHALILRILFATSILGVMGLAGCTHHICELGSEGNPGPLHNKNLDEQRSEEIKNAVACPMSLPGRLEEEQAARMQDVRQRWAEAKERIKIDE